MAATRLPRVDGLGLGSEIRRDGFWGGRKRANTFGVAPCPEQSEVGPVGLPCTDGLFGLRQIHGSREVRTKGGRQLLAGLNNGQGL